MALFKTNDELRQYYPARATFAINDLLPTLREVEQEFLAEQVLGQQQYDELEANYQDDTLDAALTALLDQCRPAVASLALYRFTGDANVEVASGGLVVTGGAESSRQPASEWRTRDWERKQLRSGMRALDVLVNFMLANVDDYPTYEASDIYQDLLKRFVRTTQQFNAITSIGNSGYLFLRMMPAMTRIENNQLHDTLCSTALRDDLLAKRESETLSAGEAKLVDLATRAVVHLTMADSIVELSLILDDRGITTVEGMLGGQTSTGPKSASDGRLMNRMQQQRNLGEGYLKKLADELQKQAAAGDLQLFAASPCYVDPNATQDPKWKTDGPVASFLG